MSSTSAQIQELTEQERVAHDAYTQARASFSRLHTAQSNYTAAQSAPKGRFMVSRGRPVRQESLDAAQTRMNLTHAAWLQAEIAIHDARVAAVKEMSGVQQLVYATLVRSSHMGQAAAIALALQCPEHTLLEERAMELLAQAEPLVTLHGGTDDWYLTYLKFTEDYIG